jgi:hypothetical protein
MLKTVVINQKIIPVPVPLRTLYDVCCWVDSTLVLEGQTVTSAALDGKNILDFWGVEKICSSISIFPEMRMEIRIEAPEDLIVQTLETIQALTGAVASGLKSLAVHLWQSRKNDLQPELSNTIEDLKLLCDLLEILQELAISIGIDMEHLGLTLLSIEQLREALQISSSVGDWKETAQILLRNTPASLGLESLLRRLEHEVLIVSEEFLTRTRDRVGDVVLSKR